MVGTILGEYGGRYYCPKSTAPQEIQDDEYQVELAQGIVSGYRMGNEARAALVLVLLSSRLRSSYS